MAWFWNVGDRLVRLPDPGVEGAPRPAVVVAATEGDVTIKFDDTGESEVLDQSSGRLCSDLAAARDRPDDK
jgi:hypothetical protein